MRKLYDLVHSPSALLAFEAAARHLSFTQAAAELNVSQPAVSAAVRKVELALGTPLFVRRHRKIELTEAGERFYADVSFGLNHILRSAEGLRLQAQPDHVTIACSTAFAHYWLVPRLSEFRAAHPGIEIRMETSYRDSDLVREGVSLGIRRGNGGWPGYSERFLMPEAISPVCAPGYPADPKTLGELAACDLIHLEEPHRMRPTWTDFFRHHGHAFRDTGAGLRLNDYALVIQAAIAGQGVAFGWHHLIDSLISQGLLRQLSPYGYRQVRGFYLVWNAGAVLSDQAQAVHDWLLSEGGCN